MKRFMTVIVALSLLAACNSPVEQKSAAGEDKVDTDMEEFVESGDLKYENYFTNKTMRVDYYHKGTSQQESFEVDAVLSDGPWPGSETVLIDPLKLGLYYFEVIDQQSERLIYSRGFASIFGEWQTIPEADDKEGSFHESIRFPWPLKPVSIIMKKRDEANRFRKVWSTEIDPASDGVKRQDPVHKEKVYIVFENGPATEKVDVVILGDGYTAAEMAKFRNDSKRLANIMLNTGPFIGRVKDINIRAVETPSEESGISRLHTGDMRNTALSSHFGSFGSERYVLSYDNKTIRDFASAVPYDFMVILFNERTYGGGGIYNLYTTVSADNKFADYIMVHEMGHHLAALADEYYTSSIAYETPEIKVEPWETNITALFDKENLKWKELVEPGTPIPTPWNKEEFDRFGYEIQKERDSLRAAKVPEEQVEALFLRQKAKEDGYFKKEQYKDQVGAFEGAGYLAKGLYRSQLDCIMYTRHMHFCKVCQRSIEDVMDTYIK